MDGATPSPSPGMDLGAALNAAIPNDPTPPPSPTPEPSPSPSPAPSPSPEPSPAPAPAPSPTPAPGDPTGQQQQQQQQPATLREWAQQQGFQGANQYADDVSFMQATLAAQRSYQQQIREMRQQQQLLQYQMQLAAQQGYQGRPQNQQYQQQQPNPLARYQAPEYNPAWRDLLVQVPAEQGGGWKVIDGADPNILAKMQVYEQWRRQNAQDFTADPVGFVRPLIQQEAATLASQLFQQQMAQMQQQSFINNHVAQNEGWIYQHDAAGQRIADPATGLALRTPAGDRYIQYIRHFETRGLPSNEAAHFAQMAIEREMAEPWYQQQRAAVVSRQQQAAIAAQGRGSSAQPTGSLVGAAQTGHTAPTPPNSNLTLHQMLEKRLAHVAV